MISVIFSILDYLELFCVLKYIYPYRTRKLYFCALILIIFGGMNYYLSNLLMINSQIIEIFLFLLDICFIFLCIKNYKLLDGLIGISLYLVSLICVVFVVSIFEFLGLQSLNTLIFPIIVHTLRSVLYYLLAKQIKEKLIDYGSVKIQNIYIMMIPIVLLIFLLFEGYFIYAQSTYYIFILFISVIAGFTTFYVIYKQYIVETENEKLKLLKKILEHSNEQHQLLLENEKEVRKIRHDMLNNLSVVRSLSIENKNKEAQDFLQKLIGDVENVKSIVYCSQQYINTLLNLKLTNNLDIEFKYEVGCFELTRQMEFDCCTVISNLLDNSIEEIHRVKTNKRKIILVMKEMNRNLFITVENDVYTMKNLLTEKGNLIEHGLGLSIVKKLVDKYQGEIEISQTDKFKVSLYLKK